MGGVANNVGIPDCEFGIGKSASEVVSTFVLHLHAPSILQMILSHSSHCNCESFNPPQT